MIYDAFFQASGQLHQLLYENEEFDIDVPFIHYTYSLIEARLAHFSDLVHAFPGLVREMLRLGDRLKVGEMVRHFIYNNKNHNNNNNYKKSLVHEIKQSAQYHIGIEQNTKYGIKLPLVFATFGFTLNGIFRRLRKIG